MTFKRAVLVYTRAGRPGDLGRAMNNAPIVPVDAAPPLGEVPATPDAPRVVVIGCGALARELLVLTKGLPGVKVDCVDARLHMRPSLIADAVEKRIRQDP